MYEFIASLPKSSEVNTEILLPLFVQKRQRSKEKFAVSPKVSWSIRNRVVLEPGQFVSKAQDLKCFC